MKKGKLCRCHNSKPETIEKEQNMHSKRKMQLLIGLGTAEITSAGDVRQE